MKEDTYRGIQDSEAEQQPDSTCAMLLDAAGLASRLGRDGAAVVLALLACVHIALAVLWQSAQASASWAPYVARRTKSADP